MKKLAIMLALILAVASSAAAGEDYKEHKIYGKDYDRHAVERLLDESSVPAVAYAGKIMGELKGKFPLDKDMPVEDAALDFIDRHRHAFGLKEPKRELKNNSKEGIRFQQVYNGVPVWGHSLSVHFNQDYDVTLIMSNLIPNPDIDTTPLVTEEEAVEIVVDDYRDFLLKEYGREMQEDRVNKYKSRLKPALYIERQNLVYKIRMKAHEYTVNAKTGRIIRKECMIVE